MRVTVSVMPPIFRNWQNAYIFSLSKGLARYTRENGNFILVSWAELPGLGRVGSPSRPILRNETESISGGAGASETCPYRSQSRQGYALEGQVAVVASKESCINRGFSGSN